MRDGRLTNLLSQSRTARSPQLPPRVQEGFNLGPGLSRRGRLILTRALALWLLLPLLLLVQLLAALRLPTTHARTHRRARLHAHQRREVEPTRGDEAGDDLAMGAALLGVSLGVGAAATLGALLLGERASLADTLLAAPEPVEPIALADGAVGIGAEAGALGLLLSASLVIGRDPVSARSGAPRGSALGLV